jgi:undecaprenyl-diphosphatase
LNLLAIVILALIQGFTEFLPVSSSGHLVLGQYFLGVQSPGIVLEIVLHLGTLVSVVVVFFRDIVKLVRAGLDIMVNPFLRRPSEHRAYRKLVLLLIVGTIPAGLAGFFLDDLFEALFSAPRAVGITLLLTGAVLFLSSRLRGRRTLHELTITDAIVVGAAQGLAITPGLSRSGFTVAAALFRDLDRDTAVRFSFLLSLPAISGAAIVKVPAITSATIDYPVSWLWIGSLISAASGVLAILWLVKLLKGGKLKYFSYYVWAIGVLTLIVVR